MMRHNYRLPDNCCASCKFSEQNMYGDYVCSYQPGGVTIDRGGYCDAYVYDETVELAPKPVTEDFPYLGCETCKNYGEGICFVKGITNPKKRCTLYDEKVAVMNDVLDAEVETIVVEDARLLGEAWVIEPVDQEIRSKNCIHHDTGACDEHCTGCDDYTVRL